MAVVLMSGWQTVSDQTLTMDDVLNHENTPESTFQYVEREEGIEIQGCTSTDEIIVVPETINGIKVTSIDDSAFADIKKTVRGLYISNNVNRVDGYSLCNFDKLEILVLGESINNIPMTFIANNLNLKCIAFKCPTIQNIEFGAINNCTSLQALYFDGDVESMDLDAFGYEAITVYGKENSNLQKFIAEIDNLTFETIK